MSFDQSKVAFVDTETTGLHPTLNPIWDIAVIVDGDEHQWQVMLPRDLPIGDVSTLDVPHMTDWVLENTRWRDEYDDDLALHPQESARKFAALVDGRHLVGAVPSFDEERLRAMHVQFVSGPTTRFPWHYHLIDIEGLMVGYLAGRGKFQPTLGWATTRDLPWDSRELSRFVGVDPDDFTPTHTALTDARWAKACFEAVMGGAL